MKAASKSKLMDSKLKCVFEADNESQKQASSFAICTLYIMCLDMHNNVYICLFLCIMYYVCGTHVMYTYCTVKDPSLIVLTKMSDF